MSKSVKQPQAEVKSCLGVGLCAQCVDSYGCSICVVPVDRRFMGTCSQVKQCVR